MNYMTIIVMIAIAICLIHGKHFPEECFLIFFLLKNVIVGFVRCLDFSISILPTHLATFVSLTCRMYYDFSWLVDSRSRLNLIRIDLDVNGHEAKSIYNGAKH